MERITLVFSASGKQGSAVVKELSNRDSKIRAATRMMSSKKVQKISDNNTEIVEVDFEKQDSLQKALTGVSRVFFLLPMSKDSENIGKNILEAVKKAKIEHVVFSSVGGADRKKIN